MTPVMKPRRIRHYGLGEKATVEVRWTGPVERPHCPRPPSIVLLILCAVCREYMLEGSHAAGYCTRCGRKHPLAA